MKRISGVATLLLAGLSIRASEFQNGQAARAVIGQSSFTAREGSFTPSALAISNGHLYAADLSHRVLTFDLTPISGSKDELSAYPHSTCPLCGFSPIATITQSVSPGAASVSGVGKTIVIADEPGHRILIWRDSSLPRAIKGPDVVLGRSVADNSSISASTIVDPISVAFDGKRLFVGDGALHRVLIWNSLPVSDNQPADAVLGQPSLTSSNNSDTSGPDTIGRPSALASDGTNLFIADPLNRRILVFTAADTPLPNNSVMNSASLMPGPVAPGTLVTITGRGLSDTSESAPAESNEALPGNLAGVQVVLNGVLLPILSASPGEVRVQFPYDLGNTSEASLYIRTQHKDGTVTITNATAVKLLPGTPGLFAFGGAEPREGMILHTDPVSGEASAPVTSDNPAKPGEVLVFWAAGLGTVDSGDPASTLLAGVPYDGPDAPVITPVAAIVSGRSAQVLSAALPHGAIGVYEVRIQLPADLTNNRSTPLLISQEGLVSNTVTIPVAEIVQ